MTTERQISKSGLAFIKAREGLRTTPQARADGCWVVGYSHVTDEKPEDVDEAEAERLLIEDLAPIAQVIESSVHAPLSGSQYDALASFGFSIGLQSFCDSGVIELINAGRLLEVAVVFDEYCATVVGGRTVVVDALVRRRADERALFLSCEDGPIAAPAALLAPVRSRDAAPGGAHDPAPGSSEPPPDLFERLARISPELVRPDREFSGGPRRTRPPASPPSGLGASERSSPEPARRVRSESRIIEGEDWAWVLAGVGLAGIGAGGFWLRRTADAGDLFRLTWSAVVLAGVLLFVASAYVAVRRRLHERA